MSEDWASWVKPSRSFKNIQLSTDEEYDAVLSWMFLNDLEGFTQEAQSSDKLFIPDFEPKGECK